MAWEGPATGSGEDLLLTGDRRRSVGGGVLGLSSVDDWRPPRKGRPRLALLAEPLAAAVATGVGVGER